MADQNTHQHLEIFDGDRAVTSADVDTSTNLDEPAGLQAKSGHIPHGSRASMVDAVLDLPEVQRSHHLEVTVPLGDAESLLRLQDRCGNMTTRAAGCSALVDADLSRLSRHGSAA
jgi:hypothetical protein